MNKKSFILSNHSFQILPAVRLVHTQACASHGPLIKIQLLFSVFTSKISGTHRFLLFTLQILTLTKLIRQLNHKTNCTNEHSPVLTLRPCVVLYLIYRFFLLVYPIKITSHKTKSKNILAVIEKAQTDKL